MLKSWKRSRRRLYIIRNDGARQTDIPSDAVFPVKEGVEILSGDLIYPEQDASSGAIVWNKVKLGTAPYNWNTTATDNATAGSAAPIPVVYLALNDSTDPDVIESGLLTGISCLQHYRVEMPIASSSTDQSAIIDLSTVANLKSGVALSFDASGKIIPYDFATNGNAPVIGFAQEIVDLGGGIFTQVFPGTDNSGEMIMDAFDAGSGDIKPAFGQQYGKKGSTKTAPLGGHPSYENNSETTKVLRFDLAWHPTGIGDNKFAS